jgi:hypothetical protein
MKNIHKYLAFSLTISMIVLLFFYFQAKDNTVNNITESPYSLKVLTKNDFWIYEVYNNDNLFIRQEYIPAAIGKQVFKTKEDAEKMGKVVLVKLSQDKFPAISISDLDANNINFRKI